MAQIRVAIAGIRGRMGQETKRAVAAAGDLELVAGLDRPRAGSSAQEAGEPVYADAGRCFFETRPDVLVDFSVREAAEATVSAAIAAGVRPVIGTTGFSSAALRDFDDALKRAGIGGLYAPNFAVGALLLMRAARMIAGYLEHAEIVEYHHDGKKDAPSGTARKTAELIAAERPETGRAAAGERADAGGPDARYHTVAGIPVHSVRLPGLLAHQEVIFGGDGEILTLRHDSLSRAGFMPGVLLGIRRVAAAGPGLVEGLEHFLF